MTKVIVTGGAGFIGSHLADALIGRGFQVAVIDNFSTGKRERVNPAAEMYEIDIRDSGALASAFAGASAVFHTAALARVQPSIKDPKTAHDVNVNGTLNVLLAARNTGVRRVVYSASSSAYGNQSSPILSEDLEPRPMSPYALQKLIGEQYCRLFAELYGLETLSLRYFNVYGPGQATTTDGPYATVIGIFLQERKAGQPMSVVPDGEQRRDFTHVEDVVRANLLAMESPRVGSGEVINVGTGRNHSVLEVARLIGGPTVFIEPRIEPKVTLADIGKARDLLGWEPRVRFEDGIAELKALYGLV